MDAAKVFPVDENRSDGTSHGSVTPEEALGISSPYSLKVAFTDSKQTCRGTWMSKFKLQWNNVEVWNYTVVLEKTEKLWTRFGTGYLVASK